MRTASPSGITTLSPLMSSAKGILCMGFQSVLSEGLLCSTAARLQEQKDLAVEIIEAFPAMDDERVYVLMDSWYTSE